MREFSRANPIHTDDTYRMESYEGEVLYENYMKIDNSEWEPEMVAKMMQERFVL